MGNKKNKIFVIALISTLSMTAGCGITITRNQNYIYSDQTEKPISKNDNNNNNQADALKNMQDERNR